MQYQPSMDAVRSGRLPFSKLDMLHRRNLDAILPQFGLADVDLALRTIGGRGMDDAIHMSVDPWQ
jgi:2-haloacid dehalogenase